MALVPGRIAHLCDDCLDAPVGGIKTVEEADGIETVPQVSQMREHPYRALWLTARLASDEVANCRLDGNVGISQVIRTSKGRHIRSIYGPQPPTLKDSIEFAQVQIHHKEPILECVRHRLESSVAHLSFIDRAVQDGNSFPKYLHTASALLTPSS